MTGSILCMELLVFPKLSEYIVELNYYQMWQKFMKRMMTLVNIIL